MGTLIAEGAGEMEAAPWMLLVPGGFLALLLLCLNIFGDGLRDALDVKEALTMMPTLSIEDLSVSFPQRGARIQAVRDVSLRIAPRRVRRHRRRVRIRKDPGVHGGHGIAGEQRGGRAAACVSRATNSWTPMRLR